MIVQLTTEGYPADEFAIGLSRIPSVDEVAERSKARKGTYAHELVASIHWSILQTLNLRSDFDTYFSIEYPTFAEYLVRRYRYSTGTVSTLDELYANFAVVLLYDPGMGILGGDGGSNLLATLLKE